TEEEVSNYEIYERRVLKMLKERWGRVLLDEEKEWKYDCSGNDDRDEIVDADEQWDEEVVVMLKAKSRLTIRRWWFDDDGLVRGTGQDRRPRVTAIRVNGERLGQALSVRQGLRFVTTPYVLATQHDWRFQYPIDLTPILNTMETHPEVKYISFISRRSQNYTTSKVISNGGFPSSAIATLPPESPYNIPLCRSFFWYDKNHIASVAHYRTFIYGHGRFKRGDFIEDKFGQEMIRDIKEGGLEAWKKYGTFLYYPDGGRTWHLVHVNGRQFLYPEEKLALEQRGREAKAVEMKEVSRDDDKSVENYIEDDESA
ncbi:hypothetical protein HDU76_012095, partial [Blyttiomyces sp. JEL0837]